VLKNNTVDFVTRNYFIKCYHHSVQYIEKSVNCAVSPKNSTTKNFIVRSLELLCIEFVCVL
jgi:hypothetical protein